MSKTVYWQAANKEEKLFIITKKKVKVYNFNRKLIFGRISNDIKQDIALNNNYISKEHGIFSVDNRGHYYMDTESRNGSIYNGKRIQENVKQYLKNGDIIQIINSSIVTKDNFITIIFSTDYPDSYVWDTIGDLETISEISIGRGSGNSLGMKDQSISFNHASFIFDSNNVYISDFNSTNGVYVDGKRIRSQQKLFIGNCIRIASFIFIYTGEEVIYQRSNEKIQQSSRANSKNKKEILSVNIVKRSVWQKTKQLMLLQDINLNIENGELVLILGGSGAGKTTFMNAVMGYEKAEGKIVHGNVDIYKDFKEVKHKIGFVPQMDLLRGSDTVYNTLSNAAEMKLPATINKEDRLQRIDKVLNILGLKRESESLVSKLSGGQRKRLSVAVEYISDPSLFFLDEPDSGLDGIMARTLMNNLRTIADEGKIVMVISHAPDRVSELFDKIIVLAKSEKDNCGHLAYFGSVQNGIKFFNSKTLEGIVQRINRLDEGGDGLADKFIEKYKNNIQGEF